MLPFDTGMIPPDRQTDGGKKAGFPPAHRGHSARKEEP